LLAANANVITRADGSCGVRVITGVWLFIRTMSQTPMQPESLLAASIDYQTWHKNVVMSPGNPLMTPTR